MALSLRRLLFQRFAVAYGNRLYSQGDERDKGDEGLDDDDKIGFDWTPKPEDKTPYSDDDSDKEIAKEWKDRYAGPRDNPYMVEFDIPKEFDDMPSVKILPVIGSAWSYFPKIGLYRADKQHIADQEKYATFGNVVKEKYGDKYLVLTFDKKGLQCVVNYEDKYPVRSEFSSVMAYRSKRKDLYHTLGVNSLNGKQWWDLRVAVEAHLGNRSQIEGYGKIFKEISTEFLDRIHSLRNYTNEVVMFKDEINKWALESLCVIAMNRRLGCIETLPNESDPMLLISSLYEQLDCMSKMEATAGSLGLWKHIPHPVWFKYCNAADTFSRIAFEYVSKTMMLAVSKVDGEAFLERMVHDENLKLNDISVLCVDMLFEGLYTTSSAVTFLLYNLAMNQDKQQKLYEEIMKFQLENPSLLPSFERIPYLNYCFKEASRLTPVSRGVARTFKDPVFIGGYLVPSNITLLAVTQVMNKMEAYFKNALDFVPERWEDARTMRKRGYMCMPFGYGKRSCLGKHVAELQISILIAEMLKRYKVEYHYKTLEIETKLINLPVGPVIFRFTRR